MNAKSKNDFLAPSPSAYARQLSQRIERLELLRADASAHRDRVRLAFINRQIKNTVLEWCDAFVMDTGTSVSRKLQVCQSPSSTIN